MSLSVSKVPRALENKIRLFGFELGDLLLIFLYLAVSNLIFGTTRFKFLFVWVATVALALFLYLFKKGKPESYLQHLGEFSVSPGIYSAGNPDLTFQPLRFEKPLEKNAWKQN